MRESGCNRFADNAYRYVLRTIRTDMSSYLSHQQPSLKLLCMYVKSIYAVMDHLSLCTEEVHENRRDKHQFAKDIRSSQFPKTLFAPLIKFYLEQIDSLHRQKDEEIDDNRFTSITQAEHILFECVKVCRVMKPPTE